ncbi:hypothetical protein V6S67_07280 [Arthrobacter sp. Soc17.1.1.1]|uniref:hypothetical protein n=1 Tax=Arthrobacter sp. Soc17.1.1.1 TaxID=3121277 RepID=UPI002FE4D303
MASLQNHPFQDVVNTAACTQLFAFDASGERLTWNLDERQSGIRPETFPPCRCSPQYEQRPNYSGLYPFPGQAKMVMFESLTEMRCLMELEHGGEVGTIAAQPFGLVFLDGSMHYPDFAARMHTGETCIIDVKPEEFATGGKFLRIENLTRQVCKVQKWEYRVMHGPVGWRADNLEWMFAFRFAEYKPLPEATARVLAALSNPQTMRFAAETIDPRMHLGLGYAFLSNMLFNRQVVPCEPGPFHPDLLILGVFGSGAVGAPT